MGTKQRESRDKYFRLVLETLKSSVKHILMLKQTTYVRCAHITDFGLITYQRILALLYMKQKHIK